MIKLRHALLFILALMIMIACSKQEMQPGQQQSEGDPYKSEGFVPFKGNFDVYVAHVIHEPPPPPQEQLVHGAGKVTHLGKTNITLHQFWWPPILPGDPGTGNGRVFFAAASGDLLLADYEDGLAYPISPTLVEITFTGYFKDGGTGRFA